MLYRLYLHLLQSVLLQPVPARICFLSHSVGTPQAERGVQSGVGLLERRPPQILLTLQLEQLTKKKLL